MLRLFISVTAIMSIDSATSAQPQAPRPIQGPAATIEDRLTALELRLERIERERTPAPAVVTTRPAFTTASAPVMTAQTCGYQLVNGQMVQVCSPAATGYQASYGYQAGAGDCGTASSGSYGSSQGTNSGRSGFRLLRPFKSLRERRGSVSGCR